jgi:hypothetical protein
LENWRIEPIILDDQPALKILFDLVNPTEMPLKVKMVQMFTTGRSQSSSKRVDLTPQKSIPPILIGRYIALACTNYAWPAASSIGLPAVGGQSCLCSELRKGAIRDERSGIPDGITQAALFVAGSDRKIALGGMDHDVETSTLS